MLDHKGPMSYTFECMDCGTELSQRFQVGERVDDELPCSKCQCVYQVDFQITLLPKRKDGRPPQLVD